MNATVATADLRERELWSDAPGWRGFFTTVDHKRIGRRYFITAMVFFAIAGFLALVIRTQLAVPENDLVGPDRYNQLFSMHGTIMMFLFAVPIMQAMGLYFVPLMLGSRAVAYPRLNAFGYWLYLFGGVMILVAFLANVGAEAGWTGYTPLSGPTYSPGKRTDLWAQMITFTEVSSLGVAVSIIANTMVSRAPGMSLPRIPLFVWSQFVTSFMVLFAMPSVMLATSFLIADRLVGTQFFNHAEGGDALLWQHLFWFFGHPEVYIIFLPALGMISAIVETFARRPIVGHVPMVLALLATGFLSFGLWVHHMFATGLPPMGNSFYTAASIMIAIPTGVQVYCWIATLWLGKPRLATPLLYVLGFFAIFVLGGLTGVMLAAVPLDQQVHDTFFVVAHFHYTLIGGGVFPLLGAFHYWFPKITGRMMSERLGKWSFWLLFIGFNVTFFPMHWLGILGMPRRVYTYAPGLGWEPWNLLATVGSYVMAVAVLMFVWNVLRSLRRGEVAGDNPWHAPGLEWATSSPPPPYNFPKTVVVENATPLWPIRAEPLPTLDGLRRDRREMLLTTLVEARPRLRWAVGDPSWWPLWVAFAITGLFIGSVFTPWAVVWGAIPAAITLTAWFWPKPGEPSSES